MNAEPRPPDAAPGGMRGTTRMHDPTEAAQDRIRRRWMNISFVLIALISLSHWHWVGVSGIEWLSALLMALAAAPLGLTVKIFELRFKMATVERHRALSEVPAGKQAEYVVYAILAVTAFSLNAKLWPWGVVGIWLYDFITYYHDRPERIRHLYAVTKTLDELRGFRAPWAWPLPALMLWMIQALRN